MARRLKTFEDVVDAFGGITKLAEFCERPVNSVYNWRRYQRFPTVLWWKMTCELERRSCTAPLALWQFEGAPPLPADTVAA